MEAYFDLLLKTALFEGFSREELARLLPLLAPKVQDNPKGSCLLATGSETNALGIVLEGGIEATKYTRAGEQFTVMRMGPGGVFGDVLSGSHRKSPVTITATGPARVMLIARSRMLALPVQEAELFRRLLRNLVAVISDKYFSLDARIDLLLIRGLRKRIAAFLLDSMPQAQAGGWFTIPYTRTAMAGYLGCERSALSRELSRMAADGLIQTHRRRFCIPDMAGLRALF